LKQTEMKMMTTRLSSKIIKTIYVAIMLTVAFVMFTAGVVSISIQTLLERREINSNDDRQIS
jgi:hypothetical protein